MAINKKLIHFKNKENFNTEVAKGNILNNSIVFILDTKEIYTHGTIYDGSTFDPSDIEASILEINNRFNISLEYDLVEYPDIMDENNNPIFTSVEEGQTLERAINTVETNVATLVQEVLDNEEVVSKALVDTANAIGLDENFHYIQNTDAKYISSATSLAEADLLLDLAIKETKGVFIITSDMFEETVNPVDTSASTTLTFTDECWSDFIEAVEANKVIALDYTVASILLSFATPMMNSLRSSSGYFILTGLIYGSDNGLVNGMISFVDMFELSPSIYQIFFKNKNVNSSILNTSTDINSTNSSNKLFLIGATDLSENSQTYSNSGVYTESGNIYASHFYETSDARHKTNIKTIIDSNNIPNLVEFDWKKDGTHSYGFIAQELEKQGYSELVNTDEEGNKTVNYSAALSLTVGKMQKQIDELEQKLLRLENIIEKFNNILQ